MLFWGSEMNNSNRANKTVYHGMRAAKIEARWHSSEASVDLGEGEKCNWLFFVINIAVRGTARQQAITVFLARNSDAKALGALA